MNNIYKVIEFPEIQNYQEESWFNTEAILINSEEGLEKFGSSAYMIPIERLNRNKLYKFRSGDESVHGIVWAKNVEKAIELINKELVESNELFGRYNEDDEFNKNWRFDETYVTEVELGSTEKVIDFIDAYTF